MLIAITVMILTIGGCYGLHYSSKQRVLNSVTGMSSITSASSEEESIIMMMLTRGYTLKYLDYDIVSEYNDGLEDGVTKATSIDGNVSSYWKDKILIELATEEMGLSEDLAFDCALQYVDSYQSSTNLYLKYLADCESIPRDSTDDLIIQAVLQFDRIYAAALQPGALSNSELQGRVAEDVIDRVQTYRNAYFHWYELILAIVAGVIAFFVPYLTLYSKINDLQTVMDEEILQFFAVIGVLRNSKQMTTDEILEWLMRFSTVFRDSMLTCSNMLPADEEGALAKLMKDEPYEPFQGIVRNLQMVDSVGVAKAFNQLDVEQINFEEKKKQDDDRRERNNASVASTLALVPLMAIVCIYLVLPWMVEAFSNLNLQLSSMSGM